MKSKIKLRHNRKYELPCCPYVDKNEWKCTRRGCYRTAECKCSLKHQTFRKRAKMKEGD